METKHILDEIDTIEKKKNDLLKEYKENLQLLEDEKRKILSTNTKQYVGKYFKIKENSCTLRYIYVTSQSEYIIDENIKTKVDGISFVIFKTSKHYDVSLYSLEQSYNISLLFEDQFIEEISKDEYLRAFDKAIKNFKNHIEYITNKNLK